MPFFAVGLITGLIAGLASPELLAWAKKQAFATAKKAEK